MKVREIVNILLDNIDHRQVAIKQAEQAEDKLFDKDQAKKDIIAFKAVIDILYSMYQQCYLDYSEDWGEDRESKKGGE